jgi:hypothetical protein
MIIREPATLITDYLLAAFTAALAWRLLLASRESRSRSQRWWALAFGASAVASFTGGTVHGFPDTLGDRGVAALWLVAMESLVVASLALASAAWISLRLTRRARRVALFLMGAAYAAYAVWLIRNPSFVFAIVAYGSALLVLVACQIDAIRRKQPAARWLVAGVAVSVLAAIVQQSGLSLHRHFNHNDLYHVIQAAAVWLLYRGGLVTTDGEERHA